LKAGAKFGFVGSSDSHRSVPGLGGALTGIFATELTPAALFDAYRRRRTVATQGFPLFVDFRAGGVFIGGEATVSTPPVIRATVETPDPIEFVELIRDGVALERFEPNATTCEVATTDTAVGTGEHFYFLRIKLVGDPSFNMPAGTSLGAHSSDSRYPHNLARARGVFAWTSPVWLTLE